MGSARQFFQLLSFFHGVPFLLRGQRIWRSVVGRPWGRFHVPGLMFLGPGTGCLPMPPVGAEDMFLGSPSDLVSPCFESCAISLMPAENTLTPSKVHLSHQDTSNPAPLTSNTVPTRQLAVPPDACSPGGLSQQPP